MTLDQAIRKIGKAMGDAKYNDAMGGAMLPHGELGVAQTLAILFGTSYESVKSSLYKVMDAEYKRRLDRAWCNAKKRNSKRNKK